MHLIVRLLEAGLLIWMALFAAIVIGRVLRGETHSSGFLETRRGERAVAPERALSMAVFPVVIVSYVFTALHADVSRDPRPAADLSDNMLMLLTGGNGVYLAGKIAPAALSQQENARDPAEHRHLSASRIIAIILLLFALRRAVEDLQGRDQPAGPARRTAAPAQAGDDLEGEPVALPIPDLHLRDRRALLLLSIEAGTFVDHSAERAVAARHQRRHLRGVESGKPETEKQIPTRRPGKDGRRRGIPMRRSSMLALLAALCLAGATRAQNTDAGFTPGPHNDPNTCSDLWKKVGLPVYAREQERDTIVVCHTRYVLSHNNANKTPDWVLEHLTRAQVSGTNKRPKVKFKPDPYVPPDKRAVDSDYTNSKFDRGHQAPSEDFNENRQWMIESFILSNVVPQVGVGFNQGIWKSLEGHVRDLSATAVSSMSSQGRSIPRARR